jgi:glycosyltransferase involved in cell wall biosynthesis
MSSRSLGSPAEARFRLLFLVPFVPRLDAPHGGGRVIGSLLVRLAERHRVALVCLRREGEPGIDAELRDRCEVAEEVALPSMAAHQLWRVRVARLRKLGGALPDRVANVRVRAYGDRLKMVAHAFQPDLVQLEMDEMCQYLPSLDGCSARRVLVSHEPGLSAARDYRSAATGLRSASRALDELAWKRFSRNVLRKVDTAVVFTERDAQGVRTLVPELPIRRIPIGVDVPEGPLDPRGGQPPTLLFFGGYEHSGNADAALRLIESIFPRLRARHPELVLQLVGARPTPQMSALAGDGIVVTGQVPSIEPYLGNAAVVVAPLRLGGGMRVKVLETLASGKALVASPRALEGLEVEPGRDVLQADSDDEFCSAVAELIENEGRRVALGSHAREWAQANLGWEHVVSAYEALYEELVLADE